MRVLLSLAALLVVASSAAAAGPGTKRNDFIQTAFNGRNDVVSCGGGVDVVSADLADEVAADCEIVARRLSVDPYANADSQHETAVEPDSFAWGSTIVAAFQLGRRRDGAAAGIGTAVSTDAGRTWRRSRLPGVTANDGGPELAASDPTVAYDAVHGQWLVGTLTIERGGSHVYVARSTDGLHWSAPVVAASGPVLDKDWIACDNNAASPFRGRCYLELTDDDQNITVSESSDDGGATWSAPVRAGDILVGTQPVIRPDGTLVVAAGAYTGQQGLSGSIVALRSADGGATFAPFTVSDLHAAANGQMRAIALPSLDVDSAGTIYAVWHDCRFRAGCAQNDMVLSTSSDGQTWSAPSRIPLSPASSTFSAFIPGLAADPAKPGHLGLVYASYVPGSCARGLCLLGMGFTTSSDGGRTWTAGQRLDAQPMRLDWLARAEGGRMVGDYFSTSFAGGRVVPVFTLATPPTRGRLHEGIFAASLPAPR